MALDDLSDVAARRDDAAARSHDERLHDDPEVGAQHTLAQVLVNVFAPLDEFEATNSVLSQLRRRGYEVRPIDTTMTKPPEDDTAAEGVAQSSQDTGPGGSHYAADVQPIDLIDALNLGFYEGQVVKYVARWRSKSPYDPDPLIDLRKALWYLERLIAVQRSWRR